jgi:hypothetical protein
MNRLAEDKQLNWCGECALTAGSFASARDMVLIAKIMAPILTR